MRCGAKIVTAALFLINLIGGAGESPALNSRGLCPHRSAAEEVQWFLTILFVLGKLSLFGAHRDMRLGPGVFLPGPAAPTIFLSFASMSNAHV